MLNNRKLKNARTAAWNHTAVVEYFNGQIKEYKYYWAEGKDGVLFLTSALENGEDTVVSLDLRRDVKSVTLE